MTESQIKRHTSNLLKLFIGGYTVSFCVVFLTLAAIYGSPV